MRALKIGGIVVGAIVVLIIVALVAVRLLVNPNDYRGRIEQLVARSTGRQLRLEGPLHLSVFPWVAIELGRASLGNPPGFPAEPFLAVDHVALRVKLLPLLAKRLEIGRVEVDGLDVRLEKNAAGQGNWEGLTGGPAAPNAPRSASAPALAGLAGVDVKNARIRYGNLVADHLDLTIGRVSAGAPVPIHLAFDLTPSAGARPVSLDARLVATADPAKRQYRLSSVSLAGTMHVKTGGPAVAWKVAAPALRIDLGAQTLDAPAVHLELASARIAASAHGTHIVDAPNLHLSFTLAPLSLRALLERIGYSPPATRDPRALSSLAASGDLAYGGHAVRVSNLRVKLDDSTLSGSAAITDLATKASRFDLAIDRIDLDRYRAPLAAQSAAAGSAGGQSAALPTELLKSLATQGTLAIGGATVSGIHLSDVRVGIDSRDGVLRIAPVRAALYGGSTSGSITLDVRERTPQTTIDQTMTNIDVAKLLQDFAKTRRLSGRGNVTVHLTARGSGLDQMLASLAGRAAANLTNGAVEGFDLGFEIERAIALVEKHTLTGGSDSGRTPFTTFKASANLDRGIATTRDLDIASENLKVTGGGTVNLATQAIDYRVKAALLRGSLTGGPVGAGALVDVPVTITGTLKSPKVRPDIEGLAKALLQQQVRKQKGRLEQQLLDRLKGLLK